MGAHAVGTEPLNYQRFFSGGPLNGVTTNTTLAVTDISSGQAGIYWVVANNNDGGANFSSGSSYNYTDPQLAPLANYGGPTLCMTLLPASPAIDNGDPSDFPAADQRGFARPTGASPDMGAYEFGAAQPGVLQLNIAPTTGSVVLSVLTSVSGSYHLQASANLTVWADLNICGPFAGATNISQTIS